MLIIYRNRHALSEYSESIFPIDADVINANQNEKNLKDVVNSLSANDNVIMSIDEVPEITIDWLREQGAIINEDSAVQFVPATQNASIMRGGEKLEIQQEHQELLAMD